ncbi:MAG: hypothetical protein Q9220_001339 [cf. Caloplaca sp. 1 TL-2023]
MSTNQATAAESPGDKELPRSTLPSRTNETENVKTPQAPGHPSSSATDVGDVVEQRDETSSETPIERQPTPVYGATAGQVNVSGEGFETQAKVSDDGRLNITINQKTKQLSDLLVPALEESTDAPLDAPTDAATDTAPSLEGLTGQIPPPPFNIVIHVVGSRGDVQPFLALGIVLKNTYGHRVRLATHGTFKSFVEDNGLEFFSIGGDPAELMAFMVKNPGLIPGMDALTSGEVGRRRQGMFEIIQGCWKSCVEPGDGTGTSSVTAPAPRPFIADAIIANPPSFAHLHCAEKLGIPLHLMFTMPWSATKAFPHPLANIQSSNTDPRLTNSISYSLVEMMTWQGLGDLINRFRQKTLGLEPVSLLRAPGTEARLRIPYTYCWSPALIPKPKDWGPHIDISGFYFLSLASNFTPQPDLKAFLDSGSPPVYIGFGSIVVDDPNAMTKMIFEAVKRTGQRALVSKGWGGLGADELEIPDGVFMLGNVPHDWLFKHVSCVVHHGGAGTTAAGIALGKPTVVVPFFGDQPFWGAMIARAEAGPAPVPYKQLTAEKLAAGIMTCLEPRTLERAKELGARISSEKGTSVGAQSFHRNLDLDLLRCTVSSNRAAVWRVKKSTTRLSALAATTLCNEGLLGWNDLKLYRPKEYVFEEGPWDPLSASTSTSFGAAGDAVMSVVDLPMDTYRAARSKSVDPQGKSPSVGQNSANAALAAGKGFGNIAGIGLTVPMNVTVGLSRGFHNAPKLYGDDTVRKADKVTGLGSGFKAAGKGFGLGIYDGITGLVTQPVQGARKGGFSGLMKGFGKGIGGLVLKPSAGACALPGYAFQGIYKEIRNQLAPGLENSIIAARIAQGLEEWNSSSQEERMEVLSRWSAVQAETGKSKGKKGKNKVDKRRQEASEAPAQSLIEAPDTAIKRAELETEGAPASSTNNPTDLPIDDSQERGREAALETRPLTTSKEDLEASVQPLEDGKSRQQKISRKPVARKPTTDSPGDL